jgi:hypothetical protein
MKVVEIIREPVVMCQRIPSAVTLSYCQKCEYFYGFNLGETKIACMYPGDENG